MKYIKLFEDFQLPKDSSPEDMNSNAKKIFKDLEKYDIDFVKSVQKYFKKEKKVSKAQYDALVGIHTNKIGLKESLNENAFEGTVKEFNKEFRENYGYISHNLSDKDVQKFIDDNKGQSLSRIMDLFQDYLLSQGLANDQE